ncbi:unnamed protein product [Trichogramma brassicae]|uniref:Uncharacterized protein n=1 Tax=Trichogramma brassicae TaxID=86971 RepID=A0A6H5IZM0_9HYME|nr:unnamed protein product [Trichogramma brassicae]
MFLFDDYVDEFKLRLVSGALAVLECLKRRGYELERSDALTMMKFFLAYKVFRKLEDHEKEFVIEESVDLEKCWYDKEEFTSEAQKIMINPSLSLYELVRLRPGEAEKRLTYEDCFQFARSDDFLSMPDYARENDTCNVHLNEILARRFCRRWTLDPLMEMTRHRLPILCCEMILKNLKNEDLCRVCFAATDHDISSINKKKVIKGYIVCDIKGILLQSQRRLHGMLGENATFEPTKLKLYSKSTFDVFTARSSRQTDERSASPCVKLPGTQLTK